MPSSPGSAPSRPLHPYFPRDRPLVIGHRGSAGTHPENTLASFEAALRGGAHILESDVHVTRDGVPILLHDPDLDRVTEDRGPAVDRDWADIKRLDAGYGFRDADGSAPHRDRGHRIPSLEEAFAEFPDARFNLEIKCPEPAAIEATLDLVERFGRADRTLLTAGEDPIMQALRSALPHRSIRPATGASLSEIVAAVGSALGQGSMPPDVMALQIPADFGGQPLATRALVEHAHAQGVEVHVWTINELAEIESLLAIGVDGIVTDYPAQMAAWLSSGRPEA